MTQTERHTASVSMRAEHADSQALGLELARAIDAQVGDRVLVFGSLPPQGRDLDLLARPDEQGQVAAVLRSQGALNRGVQWVVFRDCAAASVDLVPAADWRLPRAEADALFEQAQAVPGFRNLVAPAPAHALLIAARRVALQGRCPPKLRLRLGAILDRDPSVWERAALRAPAWKASGALAALNALHESGRQPGGAARLRALVMRAQNPGSAPGRAAARTVRRLARRPAIVALSGLDGAGKSLQARQLRSTLEQLGFRAVVVWPPAANVLFQANPAVKRRLFALLRALGRPEAEPLPRQTGGTEALEPLPPQSAPVAHALALVVALAQVWAFRRGAARAGRGADVLIYDRYALDSIVYLRQRWGNGRELRAQSRLIRLLARAPRRSFLLDVPPAVAYARKQDFPLENLRERVVLYRRLYERLGWARMDGERPPGELCAQIARSVWESLG